MHFSIKGYYGKMVNCVSEGVGWLGVGVVLGVTVGP